MTAPPVCVETDLDLRQTSCNGIALPTAAAPVVPTVLRWGPTDPWVTHCAFEGGPTWAIGWELLVAAVGHGQAGGWDVTLARLDDVLLLSLSSPGGSATFEIDPIDLAAFVERVRPRQRAAARPWIPDTAHALIDAIDTTKDTR